MPQWVPNFFTLLRLLLVPFVIRAILIGHHTEALVLFAGAAATDMVDGAIARAFQLTSRLGAYLDPIADKALLSGVFLALAVSRSIPWWLVSLIFGRDVYLLLAVALLLGLTPRRKFSPSRWGKISTFFQVVTASVWMARNLLHLPLLDLISAAAIWPCAALTIWSGIHYTWRGVQIVRAH